MREAVFSSTLEYMVELLCWRSKELLIIMAQSLELTTQPSAQIIVAYARTF